MNEYFTNNRSLVLEEPAFMPIIASSLQPRSITTECDARCKKREGSLQRASINSSRMQEVPPIVYEVLSSPGQSLDVQTRAFMEPRFGHDFSFVSTYSGKALPLSTPLVVNPPNDGFEQDAKMMAQYVTNVSAAPNAWGHDFSKVRIHTDDRAAKSAHAVHAHAYTVSNHIVFGKGRYAPHSRAGQELLAHELTHVVQQERRGETRVSRFSDTDHNIIEQVALTLANLTAEEFNEFATSSTDRLGKFTPEQIEEVHAGNTKRDYSQSPRLINFALLCKPSTFGGYEAVEHFDNFQWDEQLQKWKSRTNPGAKGKTNPIEHIEQRLVMFVNAMPDKGAFEHVGNAFHAIEDFFAHSNFMYLLHGDKRTHGKELITGSVPEGDQVSILKIIESVSSLETASFYSEQAEIETAAAPLLSHPRMAQDYKSSRYHAEAIILAALVIKEIAMDILAMQKLAAKQDRIKYVREVIMAKVKRYLRPPDPRDKWWEALYAAGGATMAKAIRETTSRTPVTTNQCILSPLRSVEASRDSNLKLIGPAFPISTKHGHIWVQVGTGFSIPPAFAGPTGTVAPRSPEFVPVGVQITGRF